MVQVNAPAQADAACRQHGGYRGCADCYAPTVTVLDAPFQPGAIYFVSPAPGALKHGRWR